MRGGRPTQVRITYRKSVGCITGDHMMQVIVLPVEGTAIELGKELCMLVQIMLMTSILRSRHLTGPGRAVRSTAQAGSPTMVVADVADVQDMGSKL